MNYDKVAGKNERPKQNSIHLDNYSYWSFFMSMPNGCFLSEILYDVCGTPTDFCYIEVNSSFEKIIGLSRNEIIGKHHRDLIQYFPPHWQQIFLKVALTGASDYSCFYSKDLRRGYKAYAFKPTEGQFAVLFSDLTKHKPIKARFTKKRAKIEVANDLEQRVTERTADLQAALRDQEAFSYSVSHELRAPLRHINSFNDVLFEEYGKNLPEGVHDYLDKIRVASTSMNLLINRLLKLSRVSRTPIRLEWVDLSEMAASTLRAFHNIEPGRFVDQIIEKDIIVLGDQYLLRQLLENLLWNAWKFTSKNTFSRIEFGKVLLSDQPTYFVKDNGAGFDMKYKERLFKAFERLHGDEFDGTGIGLSMVQRIVQHHGGEIWADGKVGEGATFHFTLSADM